MGTGRASSGAQGSSLWFAGAVRVLAAEARVMGLDVPTFRSPPRLAGADRSLRRRPGATPAVAVRLHGRPVSVIAADMVEGIVVANGLEGRAASAARRRLLDAARGPGGVIAA